MKLKKKSTENMYKEKYVQVSETQCRSSIHRFFLMTSLLQFPNMEKYANLV
jgi:hypothetical protein